MLFRSRTDKASNGQSGTGATLYAEDAEFLIREASRADQIRKDKDAQINAINNQLANALIELRNRPSRTNQSSNNGQSGTGATLFAEDAEFLIGEAARADKLRTALTACYAQYDQVTGAK